MNPDEATLIALTKRWERDQLSKRLGGIADEMPDDSEAAEYHPLSKRELKSLLMRRKPEQEKS